MTKVEQMKEKLDNIYEFIRNRQKSTGMVPSLREIQNKFAIRSTSSVAYYLGKLEEEGRIKVHGNTKRGIELVDKNAALDDYLEEIPLVGAIHAGEPVIAYENILDTYHIPKFMLPKGDGTFLLRVEGTSMIEAGINHNDLIIIKQQATAENGQIVAALVGGDSATVKRFYRDSRGVVRLHPENRNMSDIYPSEVSIIGLVVGLIRTKII